LRQENKPFLGVFIMFLQEFPPASQDRIDMNDLPFGLGRQRIGVIYGTRPEAIKLAPLITALRSQNDFDVMCISTQQHSSLLSETLGAISISTDLETSEPDRSSVQALVSPVIAGLEGPLATCDVVVVQGDSVSAFAGALAGFLQKIPVVHLEAGLRTSDLHQPHPEEGLRRAITHLASVHLAPTVGAKMNLLSEGIPSANIVVTGNTSIDSIQNQLAGKSRSKDFLATLPETYCILTVHRRENWGKTMDGIAHAILRLAERFPEVAFICPLHPNPIVRDSFEKIPNISNLKVVDPIPHDDFVDLLAGSQLILTDSGGIQEEATVLGVPVVILRQETERPEVVSSGFGFIAGVCEDDIVNIASKILHQRLASSFMVTESFPFGDGNAGMRAAQAIKCFVLKLELPSDMGTVH